MPPAVHDVLLSILYICTFFDTLRSFHAPELLLASIPVTRSFFSKYGTTPFSHDDTLHI
jgi:hypothetical protein